LFCWALGWSALGGTRAAAAAAPGPVAVATTGVERELTTDRPDATESPFTVEAGRFQLEWDAASYTYDRRDGGRTTAWTLAPFNLRYGLTPRVEVALRIVPWLRLTDEPSGGGKTTWEGFGDTTVRAKFNFWGNDGGSTALGLIADLRLPTAKHGLGNDTAEGGLGLPVTFELGAGWEGAAMTYVVYGKNDTGDSRAAWANTISVARDLAPDLGGFLELTSLAGDGAHVATFNCGLTRRVGPRVQLDLGVYLGLTSAAPDVTVFAGLARRF
jgi:hypothetical protein